MSRRATLVIVVLGLGALIQLVPYGHARTNPPVTAEPDWDSARTRELFQRACKDCHSHETDWPWYTGIAPLSWLARWDVEEAREHFNVSEPGGTRDHGDEAAEMLREGEMPLWYYLPLHAGARLSADEKAELIEGLELTFGEPGRAGPDAGRADPSHAGHDHAH